MILLNDLRSLHLLICHNIRLKVEKLCQLIMLIVANCLLGSDGLTLCSALELGLLSIVQMPSNDLCQLNVANCRVGADLNLDMGPDELGLKTCTQA